MKQYILSIKEIVQDWLFIIFFVTDLIAVILGLSGKANFPPSIYITLLLAGILISALRLITQKNKQIEKERAVSEGLKNQIGKTRPYLRLAWVTTQVGDNRRKQGITDTCIVVTNSGSGTMRSVKYNVEVNGNKIGVRNHSIIDVRSSTNMVYDDITNKEKEALGSRNDNSFEEKNNEIIKTKKITVNGSYRDENGKKYTFGFITDSSEQSWFKEKYRQKIIN